MGRLRDLLDKQRQPATQAQPAGRDWIVVKIERDGTPLTIGFRSAVPPGVDPARFALRVSVRCAYPPDATGLPASERLIRMQQLEQRSITPASQLVLTQTGDGVRESTFQVSDELAFLAHVGKLAGELSLTVETDVAVDPAWDRWREVVAERAHAQPT